METKSAKVVILCGGRGMRFHEATEFKPKPLIEIGERPILWHIMKIYAHYGYRDFVLCLGYKGENIKKFFLDYELLTSDFVVNFADGDKTVVRRPSKEQDWKVILAETGLNSMTGARLKRIEKYIDSDLFMVTYGDGLCDLNIEQLVNFHRLHNKIATITAVHPPSRFGELEIGNGNLVKTFREKAPIKGDFINGGFFVFDRRVFDYLEDHDSCILEQQPLEHLAKDGQLAAYVHDGWWQCMDTYRDWESLNKDWESPQPPWKVWR